MKPRGRTCLAIGIVLFFTAIEFHTLYLDAPSHREAGFAYLAFYVMIFISVFVTFKKDPDGR